MKKIIFLFVLSLFLYDVGLDMIDSHIGEETHASSCHAGACQTHAFEPDIAVGEMASLTLQEDFISEKINLTERFFDKSLFHPPRTLA